MDEITNSQKKQNIIEIEETELEKTEKMEMEIERRYFADEDNYHFEGRNEFLV